MIGTHKHNTDYMTISENYYITCQIYLWHLGRLNAVEICYNSCYSHRRGQIVYRLHCEFISNLPSMIIDYTATLNYC